MSQMITRSLKIKFWSAVILAAVVGGAIVWGIMSFLNLQDDYADLKQDYVTCQSQISTVVDNAAASQAELSELKSR